MTRSEMALWPQPAQSVVLLPRYDWSSRPIRFSFFPGGGAVMVMVDSFGLRATGCGRLSGIPRRRLALGSARGLATHRGAFLRKDGVGDAARVDRQAVIVQ